VVIDASMELPFIVVLGPDLSTSELPSLIEPIDGIQGAQYGLEVDIDRAVGVLLIELDMLNRTKLHQVSHDTLHRREILPWS
jgi:hypothetical protein